MSRRGGLKLISLAPGGGYGDAACQYAAGMDQLAYPLSWMPVHYGSDQILPRPQAIRNVPEPVCQQMNSLWNRHIHPEAFLLDIPPYRWHRHWLEALPLLRPYCYVAWEVEILPPGWVESLNHYEAVFVPSSFNKKALQGAGITANIELVPHVARQFSTGKEGLSLPDVRADDYVFYTIGSWTSRKALEQTIRAYLDAFSCDDPVALVIKTGRFNQVALQQADPGHRQDSVSSVYSTAWALARIIAEHKNSAKIHLITGEISPAAIDELHMRGDCFVSLTHSEGWGLGAFDAALSGKPVIITGWGGQLDYLGEDYPYLLDYVLQSTDQYADDGHSYHTSDAFWAEASHEHAVALMRSVFQKQGEPDSTACTLVPELKARYEPSQVCDRLARSMGLKSAHP